MPQGGGGRDKGCVGDRHTRNEENKEEGERRDQLAHSH